VVSDLLVAEFLIVQPLIALLFHRTVGQGMRITYVEGLGQLHPVGGLLLAFQHLIRGFRAIVIVGGGLPVLYLLVALSHKLWLFPIFPFIPWISSPASHFLVRYSMHWLFELVLSGQSSRLPGGCLLHGLAVVIGVAICVVIYCVGWSTGVRVQGESEAFIHYGFLSA
jgi:hypothetical protein